MFSEQIEGFFMNSIIISIIIIQSVVSSSACEVGCIFKVKEVLVEVRRMPSDFSMRMRQLRTYSPVSGGLMPVYCSAIGSFAVVLVRFCLTFNMILLGSLMRLVVLLFVSVCCFLFGEGYDK